jgi:hypothetical protein
MAGAVGAGAHPGTHRATAPEGKQTTAAKPGTSTIGNWTS